jgi:hypothetical protein
VLETPQPTKPVDPVIHDNDTNDAWQKKKRDHAPLEMAYTLENQKWLTTKTFIKNTIENAIVCSIAECASIEKYLEKIKS